MKFLKYFTFLLTVIASHCFAPKKNQLSPEDITAVRKMQDDLAQEIAMQKKAGFHTSGFEVRKRFGLFGKAVLTDKTKGSIANMATRHSETGAVNSLQLDSAQKKRTGDATPAKGVGHADYQAAVASIRNSIRNGQEAQKKEAKAKAKKAAPKPRKK
ncbi:hypothetical protein FJ366_01720 [Candidatus Dependentiae bacterium]|nr:hypothetical protein [Candidatus Dependentiae bacterium]